MKKILFVANVAKEHVLKFHVPTIKKFKSEGWTVDVACSGDETIPYCDTQYKVSWKRSPFTLKTFRGIKELKKILQETHYDIVYCHTPVGGCVARLAAKHARKRGTKVVYCAHGLHFFKGAPVINWLLYYPIEKMLARKTDMFITINSEDYDTVKKKFSKKLDVKIIPGIGVDFSRLSSTISREERVEIRKQLEIPESATVLVYVAELIANKNQGILIQALNKICEKHKNVYLLLVGPDHSNGLFQHMADNLGVSDHVKFTGWRSDIGNLLRASDICVASSIREGFGINLVEAMYCGLPVIASKNRGHVSIIENGINGFLYDNNDIDKLTSTINSFIDGSIEYEKFTGISVEQYDCNVIADKLYSILTEN